MKIDRRNFIKTGALGVGAGLITPSCSPKKDNINENTQVNEQENDPQNDDWRDIRNAISNIPDEGYCDQPYAVVNEAGEWVVVMTTGPGEEGDRGQHVVSTISKDQGKTWSPLVDVEPSDGPEASWATPLIIPSGRIYVFYTYNHKNMRTVLNSEGEPIERVDTLGKMMMKYSDDGGYTWSENRYEVPIRNFEIDRNNIYEGDIQFWWSVALPIIHKGEVYLPLSKVGNFGEGFMESGSGAIVHSPNILSETDPENIEWETLPDGDQGILPPEGDVGDEHNIVSMNEGSLYCVFRTNRGHNAHAYSRDDGHSWTETEWVTYSPGGQVMKQPRALNKIKKFKNNKYALFFHNNGARHYSSQPLGNRNPTWLAGGIEKDGYIYWSQPEIFFYDMDYGKGISYPDWIEDNGEYYFTETQKTIARIHKVPVEFMEMLWNQVEEKEVGISNEGLALDLGRDVCQPGELFNMPDLGKMSTRDDIGANDGFSLELSLTTGSIGEEQVILDTRNRETTGYGAVAKFKGNGIVIKIHELGGLEVLLDDGRTPLVWKTGKGSLQQNSNHHIVVTVDGYAKLLTFVINGVLWDGGNRPFGYARFNPYMYDFNGETRVAFSDKFKGEINNFKVYQRPLYTSEAIGNYRAMK